MLESTKKSEFLSGTGLREGKVRPRDYQASIAESVLEKGNTLVIMPTALGKTIVAILVMARLVDKCIAQGKKMLFLTPTKPLANQQAQRIEEMLELQGRKVNVMSGETAPEKRVEEWKDLETLVFCATPQTVEFDVLAGRMDLNAFALIVFDEAHRAVKEYSYSFIAREAAQKNRHLEGSPENGASQSGILMMGLTASPSSEKEKIEEICANLCVTNVEIRDEKDEDVKEYVQSLKVDWKFVELPPSFKVVKAELEDMLRKTLVELRNMGLVASADLKRHKQELLKVRAKVLPDIAQTRNYRALSIQAKAMNLSHALDLLETEGIDALKRFFEEMRHRTTKSKAVKELSDDFRIKSIELKCEELLRKGVEHPKFGELKEIVTREAERGNTCIVFAHYRNSVKKIALELNKFAGVKAVEFFGQGSGMTQKKQEKVLQDFRDGKHNVLVSTSSGEEGLDIPTVDLVVFFEAVPSEIRAIQRRGRAGRNKEGRTMVLVTRGTKDEAFFWISRRKEREMKELVLGMRKDINATREASPQKGLGDFT